MGKRGSRKEYDPKRFREQLRKRDLNMRILAKAFLKNMGDWDRAADEVGVTRRQVSLWLNENPEWEEKCHQDLVKLMDTVTQDDLIKELKERVLQEILTRALEPGGSDKMLISVAQAIWPEIWDSRVRAAKELNKGGGRNPLLSVTINSVELQKVKELDPAFIKVIENAESKPQAIEERYDEAVLVSEVRQGEVCPSNGTGDKGLIVGEDSSSSPRKSSSLWPWGAIADERQRELVLEGRERLPEPPRTFPRYNPDEDKEDEESLI